MIINDKGYKLNNVAINILVDNFKKEGLYFNTHPITEEDLKQYRAVRNSMLEFAEKIKEIYTEKK